MALSLIILLTGFVLLIVGGELLVRGAVRLAERLGMSQLLIGLTIVGFGTSAPELVASLGAAMQGYPDIAWGNIVGSNLANSLLILGAASMIYPMAVARGPLWRDGGLAAAATAAVYFAATQDLVNRWLGLLFVAVILGYLYYAYREERLEGPQSTAVGEKAAALEESDRALHLDQAMLRSIMLLLGGLVMIVVGGHWLVSGAVDVARWLGMSEAQIGLSVIAVGTSMPELVTAVIAAIRGASAVALGNVLGSNIFNLLLIGGLTAILAPGPVSPEIMAYSLPLLLVFSVLLMLFAATHHRISRIEGGILFALYAAVMAFSLS